MSDDWDGEITFSKEAAEDVIDLLGKTIKNGIVVEKDNDEETVPSFDQQELTLEEFGGVQPGSEIFLSNNLVSVLRLVKKR